MALDGTERVEVTGPGEETFTLSKHAQQRWNYRFSVDDLPTILAQSREEPYRHIAKNITTRIKARPGTRYFGSSRHPGVFVVSSEGVIVTVVYKNGHHRGSDADLRDKEAARRRRARQGKRKTSKP